MRARIRSLLTVALALAQLDAQVRTAGPFAASPLQVVGRPADGRALSARPTARHLHAPPVPHALLNQSNATPVAKSGAIRGRVTAADTGKPLPRARVTLNPPSESIYRPIATVNTNAQGAFEFKDVADGTYYVAATRAGYLTLQHGQRRPGERGAAVIVKGGAIVAQIDIGLPRGAVLAGRITDELGEPYPDVRVAALHRGYRLGRPAPTISGFATSDDLGNYRISNLAPGSYYLAAISQETWRNEKNQSLGFAVTYYPGQLVNMAQTVTVGLAQERAGLDISLVSRRTARLSGRVLRATGAPAAGEPVSVVLTFGGMGGIGLVGNSASTRTDGDGHFELRNVPPADYLLRAGAQDSSVTMPLTVDADRDDLVLVPRRGTTLLGTVVSDDGQPFPFPATDLRLNLVATEDDVLPTVRLPAINRDWTFRLNNVGGHFVFRFASIPRGWMIDSIKLKDADITDVPWNVPTDGAEISGLQIVLTQKIGTITGELTDGNGKPITDGSIVIFSEDDKHWFPGSRFLRTTRPTAAGTFSITNLPAGNYFAVAREVLSEGEWESREFLAAASKDAERVELASGTSSQVKLRLLK